MPLDRAQRITPTPKASGAGLKIGPEDYFVLSRIEGTTSVGAIMDAAGLPGAKTQEILDRLLAAGAIATVGVAAARHPTGSSPSQDSELRKRAARRRRQTLARGLGAGLTGTQGAPASAPRPPPKPTPEPEVTPKPAPEPLPEAAPYSLPPVAANDERLDPTLAIDLGEQRALLALLDRGESLTAFEVLALQPTNDQGAIRKAFRAASRRLHPDAYHGRALGEFAARLSLLFASAKDAVKQLADDAYRLPLVNAYEQERDRVRTEQDQRRGRMKAAKAAADEIRNRRDREEVDARRDARRRERAAAQRGRVLANLAGRVQGHLADAEHAESKGNLAAAANHYRLALRVDPNQADVKAKWEAVRDKARKERAKEAFSRANSYLDVGQSTEALPLFVEAADADPTPEHLAKAADLLRTTDVAQARELAIKALNALNRDVAQEGAKTPAVGKLVDIHLMLGRTFRDAGQKKTAKAQAKIAGGLAPDNPEVRALLNSIKVK